MRSRVTVIVALVVLIGVTLAVTIFLVRPQGPPGARAVARFDDKGLLCLRADDIVWEGQTKPSNGFSTIMAGTFERQDGATGVFHFIDGSTDVVVRPVASPMTCLGF